MHTQLTSPFHSGSGLEQKLNSIYFPSGTVSRDQNKISLKVNTRCSEETRDKTAYELSRDLYRDENTHNIYEERSAFMFPLTLLSFSSLEGQTPVPRADGTGFEHRRKALWPQKQEILLRRILPLYHACLGLVGGGQVRTLGMALSFCLRSYVESMRM